MDLPESIRQQLEQVSTRDRARLARRWQHEHDPRGRPRRSQSRDLNERIDDDRSWEAELARALEAIEQRRQARPPIVWDDSLPIHAHKDAIADLLRQHQVIIVAGETGSGKSTQLPKICLEAGFGIRGLIGHTQPRRIAARSIATRVAQELGVTLGAEVGYKIRFQDRTDPRTYIKLMTDGILLAETQNDRFLEQYEVIIIDEAHERSLNVDFLLGYLHQRRAERRDLRVIITSATLDAERFSAHFADDRGPAPIVQVSGRMYPVEIRYRPLISDEGEEQAWEEGLVDAIRELSSLPAGDILVFLPTERDIREMARRLRGETRGDQRRGLEVLPLYARLSANEQNRIFEPSQQRRVVLATNVAESSLTVPNVRYVIDTGTARISRYSPRSKLLRLPIEPVSRASADQRAGRCGRIGPGVCIRLFEEDDYLRRDPYTTPEIRRTNLASVILQAKALQLGEIETYPFLDAPHPEAIRDGYKTLFELRALDYRRQLTPVGQRLAQMPVDPRIGRMILAAQEEHSLAEVLIIAAALEIQDPRERPYDRQQQADECHEQFQDAESDFKSLLKLWDFYHDLKSRISRNQLRKACQQNYLSHNRLREWTEIHRQLLEVVQRQGTRVGPRRDEFTPIHRALLAGLLSGVAHRTGEGDYTGAGGLQLVIWPGSGLVRERPAWIMAAERLETSRRYARTVSRISPAWIEQIGEHLVKRTYSDPHWHRKSGTVMAFERVNLFGLPVVVQRRIAYGRIDPVVSRKIFIQAVLVDRQWDGQERAIEHNQAVLDELAQLAAQTRRRDFLVDDYTIAAFYESRVPADVYDMASLRRWLKSDRAHRERFTLHREDLVELDAQEACREAFPERLQIGTMELPVAYHFEPGAENDGVTLTVPAAAVPHLRPEQLGWLVPGLLEEKVVALIRSLPKALRRNFVPVPDTAKTLVQQLAFGDGPLLDTLAQALSRWAGDRVRAEDFDVSKLPPHLQINVRVVDDSGAPQVMSRDLEQLRREATSTATLLPDPPTSGPAGETNFHRDAITSWDFGELPEVVTQTRGGVEVPAYPALIEQGETLQLRLLESLSRATALTRRALVRLYASSQKKSLRTQLRWLPRWNEICLWASSRWSAENLQEAIGWRIVEQAFLGSEGIPRNEHDFTARLSNSVERIGMATQELAPLLPKIFEGWHQVILALDRLRDRDLRARDDMKQQVAALFTDTFLIDVPFSWLLHFPRYTAAILFRIDKLTSGGQSRDRESMHIVEPLVRQYEQQLAQPDPWWHYHPQVIEYRWSLEELRVSLFAQPLGTSIKISPQRLEKLWKQLIIERDR